MRRLLDDCLLSLLSLIQLAAVCVICVEGVEFVNEFHNPQSSKGFFLQRMVSHFSLISPYSFILHHIHSRQHTRTFPRTIQMCLIEIGCFVCAFLPEIAAES